MPNSDTLEAALQRVEPRLRLAKRRFLDKLSYELRDSGQRLGTSHELPLRGTDGLIYLPRPIDAGVSAAGEGRKLQFYWRAIFSLRLDEQLKALPDSELASRWRELDAVTRIDAKFYLRKEHLVPAEPTDAECYRGLAVAVLSFSRFQPAALPYVLPLLNPNAPEWERLRSDLGESDIFSATKPDGAKDPSDNAVSQAEIELATQPLKSHGAAKYAKRAATARRLGNMARSAIAASRAASSDPSHGEMAKAALNEELLKKLGEMFGWIPEWKDAWAAALPAVLPYTLHGAWPPATKFLYELQCIAVELDREIYAVDPPGWFRSFGRKPLLRKLTLQRRSILIVHLRTAEKHLRQIPFKFDEGLVLEQLLQQEIRECEERLAETVAPKIRSALDASGLVAKDAVEVVAREKIVLELLEKIAERGHIRLGDLRDAFARNAFKLPDLAGPIELIARDSLLRADLQLAEDLDGIYHRGEVYLRWFQRGSAAAFGTTIGRFVTKFAAIPFLAALMIVAFSQYLEHEAKTIYNAVGKLVRYKDENAALVPRLIEEEHVYYYVDYDDEGELDIFEEKHDESVWVLVPSTEKAIQKAEKAIQITANSWIAIGILAVFVLLLLNWPTFRNAVFTLLGKLGSALKFLLYTLPMALWHAPIVRTIRRHPITRFITTRLGLAIAVGLIVAAFLAFFGASPERIFRLSGLTFLIAALALNTPLGRLMQDSAEERMAEAWRVFRTNLLPGFFGWIVWAFREALGLLDYIIYTIDEWFRFREGQSKPSLALKVVLGLVWFPIAYIFRFAIYLLIEPQINPIKHFPTVTVSHKLLLPMIPTVASATNLPIELVGGIFTGIPGIFGFLVWELKENWRLYETNRTPRLRAISLGHHGESMRGLLRPGFHSGTIPKDFRRLRNGFAEMARTGKRPNPNKSLDSLHHIEHAIQTFTERELFAFLHSSGAWKAIELECEHVRIGLQQAIVEIAAEGFGHDPAELRFWLEKGEVRAEIHREGFLAKLNPEQKRDWDMAWAGFRAKAAVVEPETEVQWVNWKTYWNERSSESRTTASSGAN